jgi:hypothetical protein
VQEQSPSSPYRHSEVVVTAWGAAALMMKSVCVSRGTHQPSQMERSHPLRSGWLTGYLEIVHSRVPNVREHPSSGWELELRRVAQVWIFRPGNFETGFLRSQVPKAGYGPPNHFWMVKPGQPYYCSYWQVKDMLPPSWLLLLRLSLSVVKPVTN